VPCCRRGVETSGVGSAASTTAGGTSHDVRDVVVHVRGEPHPRCLQLSTASLDDRPNVPDPRRRPAPELRQAVLVDSRRHWPRTWRGVRFTHSRGDRDSSTELGQPDDTGMTACRPSVRRSLMEVSGHGFLGNRAEFVGAGGTFVGCHEWTSRGQRCRELGVMSRAAGCGRRTSVNPRHEGKPW
jgi:hypothetical protein